MVTPNWIPHEQAQQMLGLTQAEFWRAMYVCKVRRYYYRNQVNSFKVPYDYIVDNADYLRLTAKTSELPRANYRRFAHQHWQDPYIDRQTLIAFVKISTYNLFLRTHGKRPTYYMLANDHKAAKPTKTKAND